MYTVLAFYIKQRGVPKILAHWGPPPCVEASLTHYKHGQRRHVLKTGVASSGDIGPHDQCDVTAYSVGKVSQRFLAVENKKLSCR